MQDTAQYKWRILTILGIGALTVYDAYLVYNGYCSGDLESEFKHLIGFALGVPITTGLIHGVDIIGRFTFIDEIGIGL